MLKNQQTSQTVNNGLKNVKVVDCDYMIIFSLPNKKSKPVTFLKEDSTLTADASAKKTDEYTLVYTDTDIVGYALTKFLKEVR